MGNLSLVFHVTSFVVFVVLGLIIIRHSKSLKLWREWGSFGSDARILVGEPVRVLRSFARAIDAEFDSEVRLNAFPPARLRLEAAFLLHKSCFIERVKIKNSPKLSVCFVLRHKPGTIGDNFASLSQELGAELLFE
jgi:hypothetical protein